MVKTAKLLIIFFTAAITMGCSAGVHADNILLDKDKVLVREEDHLITSWNTIRPKKDLCRGISAFFWEKGVKISKFYDHQNNLLCWYCDIMTYSYDKETDTYTMVDLLADVLIYPDGSVKVVDLDELAEAVEKGLISQELLLISLRHLNSLLELIYSGHFHELQKYIEEAESL